ncbi:MAG: ribose-phosphate diphosphokinase [Candidatus Paceibacterota bacterium]|jgi:ribose-phosphate pyrophosphokinase
MNGNPNNPYPKSLFVFGNDKSLGEEVAKFLEIKPSGYEIKNFPDGERVPYQTETVRGRDVFIIFTSQNGSEIDRWLIDYLRFIQAIKRGHPYRITVILPKLVHQRGDYSYGREPKMSDFYPNLLKTLGVDYMIVCKLHNSASQTSQPPMDNLDTTFLIIEKIRESFPDLSKVVIGAGDLGGSKYGRKIANTLGTPLIIVDKDRNKISGETKAMKVYSYGDISEKIDTVIFVDDVISTGGTLCKGANAVSEQYPQINNFYAAATHADFGKETLGNFVQSKFKEIWVTNTVPVSEEFKNEFKKQGKEIITISVAKLLAKVIDNVHDGNPISSLWE